MSIRPIAALSLLVALPLVASFALAEIATSEDFQRVCREFYSLDLDTARVHDVSNAVIVRDIGVLRLTKGTLFFSKAIEGVTPVAVFLGEGSFTASPVRRMDRKMLDIAAKDQLKKDLGGLINTNVTEAVIAAFDKTWLDIGPFLSDPRPAGAVELHRAREVLKDRLSVLDTVGATGGPSQGSGSSPRPELGIIGRALSAPQFVDTTLAAEINTADLAWIHFGWNPSETYEFYVGTRQPVGAYFMNIPLIVTHRKDDFENGQYKADPVADLHQTIKVRRYRMDIEIPDLQQINIEGDVTFTTKIDGVRLVGFDLINDLLGPRWDSRRKWVDVKSIKSEAGEDLPFLHRKGALLVLLKEKQPREKEIKISFKLNENTLIQLSNVHWLMLNTYPWFPQNGYLGGEYEFDWTVKTVKPLTSTGSGKTIKTWEEARENAVQMIFDRDVQFPSIIFGRYQAERGEYDSVAAGTKIPIAAHSWPLTVFNIVDGDICALLNVVCPLKREVTVPPNKPRDVVEEGKNIIKFMEELYGPYPYEKLDVAMMAPGLGFGQAPPSFVQLTGEAFMSSAQLTSDFFHEFFSHEIAHQWWGHKIGWIADEDTWLSESFAEYSAGLYVMKLNNKKRFDEKMRQWRKEAEIADPHGSIAWCNNISGQNQGSWRTGLIYNKGPYVVHMLRMQMGMDNFKKAMQAVFAKYGYTRITTDQLKRECEAVAGYKLDYFFDQWFRDSGIPVFDYSWTSAPTDDGKVLVTVKMSQRDKENFKIVQMPVYFYFKGEKEPFIKARPVLKAEDVYQIKLPKNPVRVVLDEDHDLLATMIPSGAGAGE